jgi:hypothetical protein
MSDDTSGSRGQRGSHSDPGGPVGPQGSAPASSREILIRHLEFALDAFKNDENEGWWLNMTLLAVEGGIQAWRAEHPQERPPAPSLGRPKVVDGDVQTLLELRATNPGADCRADPARGATAVGRGSFSPYWVSGQASLICLPRVRRRLSPVLDTMGVVDQAVQDGVGVGGIADDLMPGGQRELGGDDRRSTPYRSSRISSRS